MDGVKSGDALPSYDAELREIARLQSSASGLAMKAINSASTATGSALATIGNITPDVLQAGIAQTFAKLLDVSTAANNLPLIGKAPTGLNRIAAAVSGAAGGFFGAVGLLPDVLASTTLIFNSIQKTAARHGFDPEAPEVKLACLEVFAMGDPKATDPNAQSFVFSKLAITGPALHAIIQKVSARYAAVLLSKLGGQAVPVIGAVAGATLNFTFLRYYERMAEVRFRLLRLEHDFPDRDLTNDYAAALRVLQGKR